MWSPVVADVNFFLLNHIPTPDAGFEGCVWLLLVVYLSPFECLSLVGEKLLEIALKSSTTAANGTKTNETKSARYIG